MAQQWNKDRIAEAIRLYDTGLAASEIAKLLGAASRNAVLGVIHRNRKCGTNRAKPAMKIASSTPRPKAPRPDACYKSIGHRPPEPTPAPAPRPAPVQPLPIERPPLTLVPMEGLNAHACKFPIGDPKHAGFGFCGAHKEVEAVYCSEHARAAYRAVPVTSRRSPAADLARALRRYI